MNRQNQSFIWKITYLVILAVLLVALYGIGRPAKLSVDAGGDVRYDPGGVLGSMRHDLGLAEAQIGQIDPASSTIKLATFGLRGVAIAMLWHRSQEYQKRKDWNNVIATSNQLVFLEPHFTTIWEFLGWNLSYNASSEFDDYRERYRWVIRGIDFLTRGVEYNSQAPKLCKAAGWTISQKVGGAGADENRQYRRLLREDEDFGVRHDCKLPSERDNWMLGRRWYHKGEDLVLKGVSIGNESDFLFFSNSRLNLFNYASWKRKDGIFGDEAIRAWEYAGEEWKVFSQMDLSTAIPEDGSMRMKPGVKARRTRLEVTDLVKEEEKQLLAELNGFSPDLREKLCIERWKSLAEIPGQQGSMLTVIDRAYERPYKHSTLPYDELKIIHAWLEKNEPDWRKKLQADVDSRYSEEELKMKQIPAILRSETQRDIVGKVDGEVGQIQGRATELIKVGPRVIVQELQEMEDDGKVDRDVQRRARSIVATIDGHKEQTRMSDLYRDILNFEYRIREVAVQRTTQADLAQKYRHEGRIAYYDGRMNDSIKGWYDAMAQWDELFQKDEFKDIESDAQFIREIIDLVEKFVIILDNNNKIFPDIAGDKLPMQGMIRAKLNQENNPAPVIEAMEYAKKLYSAALSDKEEDLEPFKIVFGDDLPAAATENGEARRKAVLEKSAGFFFLIAQRMDGINSIIEFMKLAPLPDVRDDMIEANALFVNAQDKLGRPIQDPLPLRSFVELMIRHDDALDAAVDGIQPALPLLRDKKFVEAQTELDKAVALWKPILEKYPLIRFDPTLQANTDLVYLARLYAETLKGQEKQMPDDFPLKEFLK